MIYRNFAIRLAQKAGKIIRANFTIGHLHNHLLKIIKTTIPVDKNEKNDTVQGV